MAGAGHGDRQITMRSKFKASPARHGAIAGLEQFRSAIAFNKKKSGSAVSVKWRTALDQTQSISVVAAQGARSPGPFPT